MKSTHEAAAFVAHRAVLGAFLLALFAVSMTGTASAAINFVQVNSATPTSTSTITATYGSAQSAGNMNVVVVGWDSGSVTVSSVSDSKGNTYKLAVSYANSSVGISQSIYYASNIVAAAAGANTVTVRLSGSTGYPDLRILEYSGVSTLDKAVSGEGTATTASSGSVTTTQASELLLGACYNFGTTNGPGSGFTQRVLTADSDNAEDAVVSASGTYSATASVSGGSGNNWVMQLATFYSNSTVSVSISPTSATLNGGGTQQFTATVTGSSNTAVTWSLSGVGTLSSAGLYTAPATVSSQTTVTVKATSQADTTKSASATVIINPVVVSVSPTSASLNAAGTQQFTATVTGSSNTAVTWSLSGAGTLSSSGLYTAPATITSQSTATITATSQKDSTKSAAAAVTLNPVSVAVSPTSVALTGGGTQQFTATVTGSSNTAVTWSLTGLGTVSSSGLYTAPSTISSQSTATVTATSQADNTKSASATVTLNTTAVSVTISPTSATVAPNGTQQFTATVTGSNNTAVTWQVNSVTGGNSTTGTVSTSGLYTAPATVPNPASVSVTAVSQADTTKSASATVTVANGLAFYVSTTGNDANNGSSGSPWRHIQHAANVAQPGDTIYVYGGTYNEAVTINVSGNSTAGYITFQNYPGQTPVIDGAGLTVSGQTGLLNIQNQNYITVNGFEIRNFSTSSTANVPIGIYITGADSYIQILNNYIHDIKTTASGCNANALGMAVYGNNGSSSINNLTISGNQLAHLTTGCSESMSLDGNVQYWTVSNNVIHDNNNIGIDAIGFEGVSPNSATDQARDGSIVGNTVYNITSYGNPAYGNQYAADGIYVDGGTRINIERNVVHNTDLNVELASEHSGKVTSYVTLRNNLIYEANAVGVSIGGYASNVGGTDHCTIVNNTLWNNDTKNTGSGEFQIQYYATNNVFKNNIVYANSQGLFLYSYTNSESNPVDMDYNLYFSSVGTSNGNWVWNGTTYTGYSSYQSATGKDPHSPFADPLFDSVTSTPPNLDVQSGSPAVNAGVNLGATVVGTVDYAGNPRVNGNGQINIGAYEQ